MTVTAQAIDFFGGRFRMTWQRVAALDLLMDGAVAAAAFHNDVIAATLAGAAAGFAVNRDPTPTGAAAPQPGATS